MKKSINIILAAMAILTLAQGCVDKPTVQLPSVDLRYRVEDSYNLPARNAESFSIVVTSSDPWTIESEHPTWCIIDQEEGEASDPDLVHIGKGTKTTVRVQYYDNLNLDDRTDHIFIKSGYWTGKKVTILQKGIAYLNISEEDRDIQVVKAGGEYSIAIESNQDWSAKVASGDWITITEGATGSFDGSITVMATDNPQEKRYASIKVYDRHGVEMYTINFTQDGVQLDPETFELRAGYDQLTAELAVIANSRWKAIKDNDNDTWYDIVNPENDGDGTLKITLTKNETTGLRIAHIILKSVSDNPDDFVAEKNIVVKQAYKIDAVRYYFDNEAIGGSWSSDWANTPVWTKGVGTLFTSQARLHNGDMPFGTYTFRWSALDPACRARVWFCYSDGQEIKFNIEAYNGQVAMSFNSSSSGISGKPEDMISSFPVDITGAVELGLKFDPSGANYCKVTYLVNGEEIASFNSSDSVMHEVTWGSDINMYIGVDTGGSAVVEWYDYIEPVNWEE